MAKVNAVQGREQVDKDGDVYTPEIHNNTSNHLKTSFLTKREGFYPPKTPSKSQKYHENKLHCTFGVETNVNDRLYIEYTIDIHRNGQKCSKKGRKTPQL